MERLKIERESLIKNFERENIIIKKLEKCQDIINLCEELLDEKSLVEYQKRAKVLIDDIDDRKVKLRYYLNQAKEALMLSLEGIHGKYKDVYSYLYSFSSKLKNLIAPDIYQRYYELAKKFMDTDKFSQEELSYIIKEVLEMDDNIDHYLLS